MDIEVLSSYGIEYDRGLKNCMGNVVFYKKILTMFLQDGCFMQAKSAYASGDRKELFSRLHELKGISGNAALTALYNQTVPLVELLRKDTDITPEMFAALEEAYQRACEGIALFVEEP